MTPYFVIWSLGPKTGSVDGICHQPDFMNRFYLDVKAGPNTCLCEQEGPGNLGLVKLRREYNTAAIMEMIKKNTQGA